MNAIPFPVASNSPSSPSLDVTFLTKEQIWGSDQGKGQLQVMKDYGVLTSMSDLTILLGGIKGSFRYNSENEPSCHVWTSSSANNGNVNCVRSDGLISHWDEPNHSTICARPVLPSSVTSSITPSMAKRTKKIGNIQVVEYGEYPQAIAPENVALEVAFSKGKLQTTGKTYTFNAEDNKAKNKPFNAKKYDEYQINNRRYIRVEAQLHDENSMLSNGKIPQTGEPCWIEVQPIEWLQDPTGMLIARQALFSGMQFDSKDTYDGDFNETDIKKYLNTCFAKEMQVGRAVDSPSAVINSTTVTLSENRAAQRRRALENPEQGL